MDWTTMYDDGVHKWQYTKQNHTFVMLGYDLLYLNFKEMIILDCLVVFATWLLAF